MATASTQVQVAQIAVWADYKSPVDAPSAAMMILLESHAQKCAEWLLDNRKADEKGFIYLHIANDQPLPRWFTLALHWLSRDASPWEIKMAPLMGSTIYRLRNLSNVGQFAS